MKTIAWSLGVGLVTGVIAFLMFGWFGREKPHRRYDVQYSLRLEPEDTHSVRGPAMVVETERVLRRRFTTKEQKFESVHRGGQPDGTQLLDITVRNLRDTTGLDDLVRAKGRLQFWETLNVDEVQLVLRTADSVAISMFPPEITAKKRQEQEHIDPAVKALMDSMDKEAIEKKTKEAGLRMFIDQTIMYAGLLGKVKTADTAMFGKILRSGPVVASLPFGVRLLYNAYPDEKGYLSLHIINTGGRQKAILENPQVDTAYGSFDYAAKPVLYLNFSYVGARDWEVLTGRNTGRAIAIVVDDRVITAPVVQSAIPGGAAIISGDFTPADTRVLASKIRTPVLPSRVYILNCRVTSQKGIWNSRHVLLSLLVFGLASMLSWFVFKALKST